MNNYIIIDADKIKQRIEDFEQEELITNDDFANLFILKDIIRKSIPLNPEIDKAYSEGLYVGISNDSREIIDKLKQKYLSQLNLSI